MKPFIVTAASAIFFAAVITELSSRLWPASYTALLLIAMIALFINGQLNRVLALRNESPAATRQREPRPKRQTEKPSKRPQQNREPATESAREAASGPRERGTVKWFNRTKGFGFIIRESGEEIFVHQRSIRSADQGRRPSLKDGQAVSFQVAKRDKGLQAEDVATEE